MKNKAMRILIADENRNRLVQVERSLNCLGYYRVAPISTFEELLSLTHSSIGPFELLIMSKNLADNAGADLNVFRRERPNIRHMLVYESQRPKLNPVLNHLNRKIYTSLLNPPDSNELEEFMAVLDPLTPWACLTNLPWLQELTHRKIDFSKKLSGSVITK